MTGRKQVSEVELILVAGVLRALDRLRAVGAELTRTGVMVEGSRKQARPHPLLRVEAELRTEVARGFRRLGVSGWNTKHHRLDAEGRFIGRH